jgi:segregation and condensation protein B
MTDPQTPDRSHQPGAEDGPERAPASPAAADLEAPGHPQPEGLFDAAELADAPRMPHALKPVVEALIFASPEPITVKAIVKVLDQQPKDEVEAALAELRADYQRSAGLQLVEVAGGFQIVTRPELYEWVRRLFKERTSQKLSVQALETLAVIAYKQPVTSAEISEIRGVTAASGVLGTLLDRKLVKIVGRKQVVGRPFMYGTTREFLDKFGLKDLSDLPKVEDMSEALGFDLPTPVDEEVPLPLFGTDDLDTSAADAEASASPADAPDAKDSPDAAGLSDAADSPDTTDFPDVAHSAHAENPADFSDAAHSPDDVRADSSADGGADSSDDVRANSSDDVGAGLVRPEEDDERRGKP